LIVGHEYRDWFSALFHRRCRRSFEDSTQTTVMTDSWTRRSIHCPRFQSITGITASEEADFRNKLRPWPPGCPDHQVRFTTSRRNAPFVHPRNRTAKLRGRGTTQLKVR